jgi:hypothetical protein
MDPQEHFDRSRELIEQALATKPDFACWEVFPHAFYEGVRARSLGMSGVSPYYEDDLRTPYWLAGYCNLEFVMPRVPEESSDGRIPPNCQS